MYFKFILLSVALASRVRITGEGSVYNSLPMLLKCLIEEQPACTSSTLVRSRISPQWLRWLGRHIHIVIHAVQVSMFGLLHMQVKYPSGCSTGIYCYYDCDRDKNCHLVRQLWADNVTD